MTGADFNIKCLGYDNLSAVAYGALTHREVEHCFLGNRVKPRLNESVPNGRSVRFFRLRNSNEVDVVWHS